MVAPPPQRKLCMSEKIFTTLLKSPVVNVPSNGVTNNLKKEGRKRKRTQKIPNICKFGVGLFDPSTCEAKLC